MSIFTPRLRSVTHQLLSLLILFTLLAPLLAPLRVRAAPALRIVYVKPDAADANSGNSWEEARRLQGALGAAVAGDEIWVAAGVYYPGASVSSSFQLKSGVALYGGFAGSEDLQTQRKPATQVTVLSGDIDKNDTHKSSTGVITDTAYIVDNNAYIVITGSDTDSSAILDGFTITAGNNVDPTAGLCDRCGAGLKMINGNATLANLTFSANSANFGAGMFMTSSSPTLTNVTFIGNKGYSGAGAMHLKNSSPALTNVTFSSNVSVAGNGGGMYNNTSNPTLTKVTFTANSAIKGGAMYNNVSSPTLTNAIFSGNWTSDATNESMGGAMFNINGSNPILTNAEFRDNTTRINGGGMYNEGSSPILTNVIFSGNFASYNALGGGMYNQDASNPTLEKVTFIGNHASYGGGLYNNVSSPKLISVIFSGNRADNEGGGMANEYASDPILADVLFSGNRAINGTGIYNYQSSPTLTNVTFSGNQATNGGGGIVNEDQSHVILQNAIMWNNTTPNLSNDANSTFVIEYSLVQGLLAGSPGNLDGTVAGNAPRFVRDVDCGADGICSDNHDTLGADEGKDDDYGDMRLQGGSPAVDAGDNDADLDGSGSNPIAGIDSDLAGQPRIVAVKSLSAIVDMGAYETASAPPSANAGGPYNTTEGSGIKLDGTASSDDAGIVRYGWDCTGDGSVDVSTATATGSSCTYPDSGSYALRLTVTDNISATGTVTTLVTVANVAPIYSPASDQSTFAANAKLFALGTFADPGAEGSWPVTIDWGDDTALSEFAVSAMGSLPTKSHIYAAAGTFNVRLIVSDGESSDDDSFQVVVNPPAPGAPNVTSPADQTATAGIDKSFALGSFSDPGSSAPWQVSINWGDGSATKFSAGKAGALASKPHTYAANGTYDALVAVSDGSLSASSTFRVVVSAESNAGSVAGLVFDDANANGAQAEGEQGVAGAEIRLETTAQVGVVEIALTRSTTTDADGRYRFDNVPPDDYTLTVTAPAGYATLGAVGVPLTVQTGETTAATFTLQVDESDGGSVFLPVIHP